jgi:hypothetical protein
MLSKLSVTVTCLGTLVNVSEMSPELLFSQRLPARPEAERVPKVSARRTFPVSRDPVRSPELSESATVPCSPLASSAPNESLTLTPSPAGTVTPRLSEQ